VTRDGKEPYAVLSIGAFLGMGAHLAIVRYDSLKFSPDNKIVLPGGSQVGPKKPPPFAYSKERLSAASAETCYGEMLRSR
jgi:hypothetical protein